MNTEDIIERLTAIVVNQSREIESLARSINAQHNDLESLRKENAKLRVDLRTLEFRFCGVKYA